MGTWLDRAEPYAITVIASLALVTWTFACVFGFETSPPLNVRFIRYLGVAFVLSFGILAYYRPWWCIGAFLVIWPHMLVLRELFVIYVRPWGNEFPVCWDGPLAASLVIGLALRPSKQRDASNLVEPATSTSTAPLPTATTGVDDNYQWIGSIRICIWLLIVGWLFASLAGILRTHDPEIEWHVNATPWVNLLAADPYSVWAPVRDSIRILPAVLFGAFLLRELQQGIGHPITEANPAKLGIPPTRTLLLCAGASGLAAGLMVGIEIYLGKHWSFDLFPPGGPFTHRNTVAPYLFVTGAVFFALSFRKGSLRSLLYLFPAILCFVLALSTGSRNAVLLTFAFPLLLCFTKAGRRRLAACAILVGIATALLLWAPLPNPQRDSGATRWQWSVMQFRKGNWDKLTRNRTHLWGIALSTYAKFPISGSGVGTFAMVAKSGTEHDRRLSIHGSAHSVPLHLLAETGLLGSVGWCGAWVLIPMLALIRWRRANFFMLVVLTTGLANMVDTVWLVPGMATFSVLLLWLACSERAMSSPPHS